ncbi:MAG: bifunctional UDP-N-acetylmuramoyl-tripeptide:D-alanyl-D-alanine ligase/alanine racemase [Marinilabiliales bacterium]|nr:MAG: bifunctional UDP-N-acetylmuramoyl-tripeptide:D-alanyl-D-alanine ligase/alanine racemase [Marinilabiliales bacterium]
MLHNKYSSKEIAEIIGARILSKNASDIEIKDILVDSRRLISPDHCLFFALITSRGSGHKYIHDLYTKGVRAFVVSQLPAQLSDMPDAVFLEVDNTLIALQKLTAKHRSYFDIPVIGVTGSNGKTIIKEWLYQLLGTDKKVIRSPKSYNSQVGVPLSVWQLNQDHELAIFEAGISEPEEMQNLQKIIKPTIGIFTNIGQAHDENFINTQQKIGEKLKLFTKVDTLIYNSDQKELKEVIIKSGILNNINTFCWGKSADSDLEILHIEKQEKISQIRGVFNKKELSISIPFTDNASIENAIHCWATMLFMGVNQEDISERMKALTPIAMRLELKEGINNCTIINDAYNSDFNSLGIALDFLNQQNQHRNKLIILSDILQSGRNEVDLYTEVGALLEQKNIDEIIGIGPAISRQADKFNIKNTFFKNTEAFLQAYPFGNFNHQSILLKGARIFEFEQISRILQQKLHETVMEINLDALVANLNTYKALLSPNTRIMAMVKAFSYGSGGFEIANILQFHRVDYLAVAYADEGVDLRKAGISMPIMVMSPEEYAFETMIRHQLEPEIFSFRALRLLEKAIKRSAIPQNKPVKIHLKLDTGMHRLGFNEAEIDELVDRLKKNPLIYVQSIFSHLAGSDKPDLDNFTNQQINSFTRMSDRVISEFDHEIFRHILNSAGIIRFPQAHFNMVRLGIGLYGINTILQDTHKLENVASLRSVISQIRTVKKGNSVSYNRSFIADEDIRVGIVSIGYADGLLRSLGNRNVNLLVNDQLAPVIGDICMDMCVIDLTGIDAQEGDDVIIFNANHPLEKLSEAAHTIPYEILSRISRRVKRVYYHE